MDREKIAFKMVLNANQKEEYKRRHDEIWPKLSTELKNAGVHDYSIFYDEETHILFATMWRDTQHTVDKLPETVIVKKWWAYMADIMETHPDNSPVSVELERVFHMD